MTPDIKFDYKNATPFIKNHEIESMQNQVTAAHNLLHSKKGSGSEYLGWLNLPNDFDKNEHERIKKVAEKISNEIDVFIVIGIGGSYLGAKSAIEMLKNSFYNQLSKDNRKTPEIYFAGNNISSTYLAKLVELVKDRDFAINVVSKSGTTIEPAIAFRIFRELLENKYGSDGAKERIITTTDKSEGALKKLSDEQGYESFVVPDDIGGRYSVLTAVGLFPLAVAGIDIDEIMSGAAKACDEYNNSILAENPCYQYAAIRNILYANDKNIELLVNYEPDLTSFAEWWKQLFGESEGKDNKGIFPASANFSTDLHSLGQYIQDGKRNIFATTIWIENPTIDIELKAIDRDIDGLNFLAGKTIHHVNEKTCQGAILAHTEGGVPNLKISIPELSPYTYGQLVYFFKKACAISGYLLGVNPFDQPGVETYKKNMFALLDKPGTDDIKKELEKKAATHHIEK